MEVKYLVLVVAMLYIVDVSNALKCYTCNSSEDPACGQTVSGSSGLDDCMGKCMVSKTSMNIGGSVIEVYSRSCEEFCPQTCMTQDGVTMCSTCCDDRDGCNDVYQDQAPPPTPVADLMCYNCSSMIDPTCSATLGDTSNIQTIPCSGTCIVMKSSMDMMGTQFEAYQRTCQPVCFSSECLDVGDGVTVCSSCCSDTTLCNANYVDPSQTGGSPGQPEPEPGTPAPEPAGTPAPGAPNVTPKKGLTPPPDNEIDGKGGKQPNDAQPNDAQQGATANPVVQDGSLMTTKSSAINVIVNVSTILFAYLLSTTLF